MKKSQRLRLLELTGKPEASRTAAEQTELGSLTTLASQHPDASKDSDDAAPPAGAPSPAAGANAPPATLGTLMAASLQALRGRNGPAVDLVTARTQLATLTTERDTALAQVSGLNSQLSALNSQLSGANAALDALCGFLGFKASEFAGKKPGDIVGIVSAKVSLLAGEQLGALGFPASSIPASSGGGGGDAPATLAELQAEYAGIKDPVAAGKFYAAKIAPLFNKNN